MNEWNLLSEFLPHNLKLVLGCDWYPSYKSGDFRMHVCSGEPQDAYYCREKTGGHVLSVENSICPQIGNGESAYWMKLPEKDDARWIKFDIDYPPVYPEDYHELLLRLHNGSHYVGCLDTFTWSPSFSLFKYGELSHIDCYMELPEQPKFMRHRLTPSEKLKRRKLEAKFKRDMDELRKIPNSTTMKFRRFKQEDGQDIKGLHESVKV